MKQIALNEPLVDIVGALDFDERDGNLLPRRLPAWTRQQVPEMMAPMVTTPSGVRIRFASTTRAIELDTKLTLMALNGRVRPATFDLVIDGKLVAQQDLEQGNIVRATADGGFSVERGNPTTVSFTDLPAEEKVVELWLPVSGQAQLRGLRIDADATIARAPDARPIWAHYGSSISQCSEAERPTQTWPATAARLANVSLRSFGFGGQCHLDPFLARTLRDVSADFISVKVGINIANMDSMRERIFAPLLHGFIDTIREQQPDVPLLLVSPIFCPSAEQTPGPTIPNTAGKFETISDADPRLRQGAMHLQRMRELIAQVQQLRAAGDPNLHYLDGLELFSAADSADLPDDLHPNTAGYVRMGERFAKLAFAGGAFARA